MIKSTSLFLFFIILGFNSAFSQKQEGIYHDGWIDLNKNGKKDVYEDRSQAVDSRVNDLLSQISL